MTGERTLFERSAREMRPEFRARMRELLELAEDPQVDAIALREEAPPAVFVDVDVEERPASPDRPRRPLWLPAAAAVVAVVAGVALLQRGPDRATLGTDPSAVVSSPDGIDDTGPSSGRPACVVGSDPVAVALDPTEIAVSPTEDGWFCVHTGEDVVAVGSNVTVGPTDEPVLVESGPLPGTTGYYYLFAVPERLPVNRVTDEFGDRAQTVTNPIGRRLLIVEADVDPAARPVTRSWDLSIDDDGPTLATVTAPGPLPRDRTTTEGTPP